MDGYQFFASVFQSIVSVAWPVAIFGVAWLFRQKLFELLPLLQLKYKDVEASFRLDQAEKEAAELLPPAQDSEEPSEPTPEEKDKFEQIAELSPRAAILEVRSDLDEELKRLVAMTGIKTDKTQSTLLMTRMLRHVGAIDSLTSGLLDDLRVVGNSAAHGGEFTKEDAIRFRQITNQVIPRLTAGKFLLKKSTDGQFYFRLQAGNGEPILRSELYTTRASAETGIASVKTNAPLDERYERKVTSASQHIFKLKAANSQIIGTSEKYKTEAARDNAIASVKANAPTAMIEDQT